MIVRRNLAKEYASLFRLEPQAINETGAQFRERVARKLHEMGEPVYAQEALHNDRMSNDLLARGSLDRGYGDKHITEVAETTESYYIRVQDMIQSHERFVQFVNQSLCSLRLRRLAGTVCGLLNRRQERYIETL